MTRHLSLLLLWGVFIGFAATFCLSRPAAAQSALVWSNTGSDWNTLADEAIPPETVAAIKAATVFVKVEAERLSSSASGFVIKTEGDTAYVATNHHVIEPKEMQTMYVRHRLPPIYYYRPPARVPPGARPLPPSVRGPQIIIIRPRYYTPQIIVRAIKNAVVTVVFYSGSHKEQAIRGKIVAVDPDQDLAVVKVTGVKEPPRPIDYVHEPKLVETMPIYTFGYPFGKALSTSEGGPAITVGKGAISSLRTDDKDRLALVQIDGALNPGNSGGPVVDAQGRLVGVAVATIRDSSGIGLAVPGHQLSMMLQGCVGKVCLSTSQDATGLVTVHVEAALIDPLDKIRSAALHYVAADSLKDKPKPTDPLEPLPGCRRLPLKLEKHLATGEFTLDRGAGSFSLLHQAVYVNESGKPVVTPSVVETLRIGPASSVATAGPPAAAATTAGDQPSGGTSAANRPYTPTLIFGGGMDPKFTDAAPPGSLLTGFEVGLGKWAGDDVVCALRPIFSTADGEEIMGRQHGTDTSHAKRLKAKPGYAVAAVTIRAGVVLNDLFVTFMKIDKDRFDPTTSYQSEWVSGKVSGAGLRLGGGGAQIIGIVGKENSQDFTGLGLMQVSAGGTSQSVPAEGRTGKSIPPPEAPPLPPATSPALEGDRAIRNLPGLTDEVVAGGSGRYLLLHLPKLRKLAVFDAAQAKIAHYISLTSDDVLFAAGSQKLIVVARDQNLIQRYDLATQKKELTVSLPEVGQLDGMVLGHASAGPAMLMTRQGPRFLDQAKLTLVELKRGPDIHWLPHPQYPLKVRASADGSTFAAWQPGVSPGGIRVLTLQGDIAHSRYAHDSAGVLQPSYDGRFLFTETGIYSADLRPVAAEQFRGLTCFPCCHPAYFLAYSGENGFHNPTVPTEKPKLSLYATGDKRPLLSFTEFEELSDPSQSPFDGQGPLAIDKRIHFFPAANLLVTIPPARDRLVLRKLDLTAALEKAGIDYLYVASLPPATAERGGTLTYQIEVKSRRGGVRCTLDSGPEGLTLSDDGKLLWKVPSGEPSGQQGVIITIRDSSGQEIMHTFNLLIR